MEDVIVILIIMDQTVHVSFFSIIVNEFQIYDFMFFIYFKLIVTTLQRATVKVFAQKMGHVNAMLQDTTDMIVQVC